MVYLLNINMQRRKWAKIQIIADQLLEEKLMPVDKVLVIKAMALWAEYFVKGAYSPKIEPLCP